MEFVALLRKKDSMIEFKLVFSQRTKDPILTDDPVEFQSTQTFVMTKEMVKYMNTAALKDYLISLFDNCKLECLDRHLDKLKEQQ